MEQVGPHIEHCAHEQAASASALNGQTILGAVPMRDQILGAGNEVGKCIFLVHHAPVVVPGFAQLAATANVRVRDGDTAVDQAEKVGVEIYVVGDTVGTVAG